MKWSRYSRLFESERNGWLLYSSASGAFLKISEEQIETLQQIMNDPEGYDYSQAALLYMQLRSLGVLVEDGKDEELYNIIKMRHLTALYADQSLTLTIAVTSSCNFDCSYCFEANHQGHIMSEETEDRVMRFIKSFRSPMLHITWYGGEPMLALERMRSINKRLKDMGKRFDASMITNGYLLTQDKVKYLNELNISYLQITLDGKKETHDARRYLTGGAGTYDRIISNIDAVMKSDFRGTLHIRVNVDGRNDEEFAYVYQMMQKKYPRDFGRRITVYPGFVRGEGHPDSGCFFDPVGQGEFLSRMMEKYQIAPLCLYPKKPSSGCVLTKKNAFVAGPDGELYKCWDDVGNPERIVGSVDCRNDWNMGLIAEGMTGCSFLDDAECRECFYFPVCNGGCHRIRQNNLHSDNIQSTCTYFKGNIERLLELHYEMRMRQKSEASNGNKA